MTASFGNLLHQLPGLQMLRSNILCCSPLIFTSSFLDFISSSKLFHSRQYNSWNLLYIWGNLGHGGQICLDGWIWQIMQRYLLPPIHPDPSYHIPVTQPAPLQGAIDMQCPPPLSSPPVSFVELEDISSDGKFTLCALAAFEKRQHVLLWDCWDFVSTPL